MTRINNKDILIGYISTLTDRECKDIYYLITGSKDKYTFSKGLVKLTDQQYNKLIWIWGKEKADRCIDILDEWMQKKGDKLKPNLSCYNQLITWVDNAYYNLYPLDKKDKTIIHTNSIDTAWKARKYIRSVPAELRAYDSEVKYLVQRFGKDILP
jgi:hypothetical protein